MTESTFTSIDTALRAARAAQLTEPGVGVSCTVGGETVYVQWVLEDEFEPVDGPWRLEALEVSLPEGDPAVAERFAGLGFSLDEELAEFNIWTPDDLESTSWPDEEALVAHLAVLLQALGGVDGMTFTAYP